MSTSRESKVESREPLRHSRDGVSCSRPSTLVSRPAPRAFTLIEIMIVVAIIGVVLAAGIPSLYRAMRRDTFRQAVTEVLEACSHARARAILEGVPTELRFHFVDNTWTFEVGASTGGKPGAGGVGGGEVEAYRPMSGAGLSGRIGESILVEMLDVNFAEYVDVGEARVRFYPNGTSDEFHLVLRSDRNEQRLITLEVVTGLASFEVDLQEFKDRLPKYRAR